MDPALGVSHGRVLLGIPGIGGITVTDQGAAELTVQHLFNVGAPTAVRVGEHHFVGIAVQWPEPAGFHFAFFGPRPTLMAGFDGRLIHGQHPAAQNIVGLGVHNGPKQVNGTFDQVGQGAATDRDPRLLDALVLAIQRQMELELVHQ